MSPRQEQPVNRHFQRLSAVPTPFSRSRQRGRLTSAGLALLVAVCSVGCGNTEADSLGPSGTTNEVPSARADAKEPDRADTSAPPSSRPRDIDSLIAACAANDVKSFERLLREVDDVNTRGDDGMTPLCQACLQGNGPLAFELLGAGADPNFAAADGRTPLHCACDPFHAVLVQLLLNHGADSLRRDDRGRTPIDLLQRNKLAPSSANAEDLPAVVRAHLVRAIELSLATSEQRLREAGEIMIRRQQIIAGWEQARRDLLAPASEEPIRFRIRGRRIGTGSYLYSGRELEDLPLTLRDGYPSFTEPYVKDYSFPATGPAVDPASAAKLEAELQQLDPRTWLPLPGEQLAEAKEMARLALELAALLYGREAPEYKSVQARIDLIRRRSLNLPDK